MTAKKITNPDEISPILLKFREKRKWQINLRRYVLKGHPCSFYAPYFGLDIKNIRKWFENQFEEGINWENFGKKWQFEHIIPVTYFDFLNENELRICWNFTNLRIENLKPGKKGNTRLDLLIAKKYFSELYDATGFEPCILLLSKIEEIESAGNESTLAQQTFINEKKDYLEMIKGFSAFEFELINNGKSIEEVKKEIDFLKNLGKLNE
jgi:hypothetical protein